jgi:hypothetical protein
MFKDKLKSFFWVPIETPISGGGVPDHYFCRDGVSGWNEYKLVKSGWTPKWRAEQIGWHSRLYRAGGRSFIVIRRHTVREDELWIYPGKAAQALKIQTMRGVEPILKQAGGPSAWDWAGIGALLVSDLQKLEG